MVLDVVSAVMRSSSQAGRTLPQGRAASAIPCPPDVNLIPLLGYHASVVENWCRPMTGSARGWRFQNPRPVSPSVSGGLTDYLAVW